jgi:hypothetical protein
LSLHHLLKSATSGERQSAISAAEIDSRQCHLWLSEIATFNALLSCCELICRKPKNQRDSAVSSVDKHGEKERSSVYILSVVSLMVEAHHAPP